jgi:hypothetical protein
VTRPIVDMGEEALASQETWSSYQSAKKSRDALLSAIASIASLVIGGHDEGGFNRSQLCEAVSIARAALKVSE